MNIQVIGGGLSGCEAALQLAAQGFSVDLHEMRPKVSTPAHRTGHLAELVCSNSFKGLGLTSAHGLFKAELQKAGSKVLPLAFDSRVPAGESLAIDRDLFSAAVEAAIGAEPRITVHRDEVKTLDPHRWTLIATGPLSSEALTASLLELLPSESPSESPTRNSRNRLFFFDSIAPVVEADSLDNEHLFAKNRWEKGDAPDFLNCPLDKETYLAFVAALTEADTVEPKPFEKGELFEGCLPIEEMARRGPETLRHGPMRPIGLRHPETGKTPYAVVQLRAENRQKTLYNLVGFQTRLKWGTQKTILSMVPALREANFVRLGAMHRNTFLHSPTVLTPALRIHGTRIFCAGQITGAEGYTEALGTGLYAASTMAAALRGDDSFTWPSQTCLGALTTHLTSPNADFQPMNFNFGLLPKIDGIGKNQRKQAQIDLCLQAWEGFRPFPE
jgi:methylenetetrahydrofolate--tRNA-(uracil-5-)-methyltransferase